MKASVRLDHSLIAVECEQDVHAMVEIAAPDAPASDRRPPVRLAVVLDRSGSMHGKKLAVAKRCAGWLVSRLGGDDEVALVDYDDEVRLLAPLSSIQADGLETAIRRIHAGGSTNLSGGWLKGLEQLRGRGGKVLLLTDGLANVGITDHGSLVSLAGSAFREGIGTSTIGLGADYDEELLTAMADAGGGNYHFAETPDAAPGIFARELEGLTTVVAQNVSLEIRPREQVEMLGVLNDYPAVPVSGGLQVQVGDAYGGDRRRIVFALHVPRLGELGVTTVADLVLRYVAVGEEIAAYELTIPVTVNAVSAAEAAASAVDEEVREEVLVLRAARARDEAIELADAGDFAAAQAVLGAAEGDLRAAGLAAEADALPPPPTADAYDRLYRKRLSFESYSRRRKRG